MDDIQAFIRRLPKAELHLHLEGTISPATLVELSQRHDATPITLPEAEALYRFTNFTEFINAFRAVTRQLAHADDYELAAWRVMQHLADLWGYDVLLKEVDAASGTVLKEHTASARRTFF